MSPRIVAVSEFMLVSNAEPTSQAQIDAAIVAATANMPSTASPDYLSVALAFNVSRRPSLERDVFVTCSARVALDDGEEGRVELQLSSNGTTWITGPTVIRKYIQVSGGGGLLGSGADIAERAEGSANIVVPKGWFYRVLTQAVSGSVTFTMVTLRERIQ